MAKIEFREDGPMILKDCGDFRMTGVDVEVKPMMALCRCGASGNKPFCDGSHKVAGYTSAKSDEADPDRVHSYEGTQVSVHFNKLVCSHAGACLRLMPDVFDLKQRPWIQVDDADVEDIKRVVRACPSGALQYSEGGDPEGLSPTAARVSVEPNGPYRVQHIECDADDWAAGQDPSKYVLCRCGLSKNKPFCDGTHFEDDWKD